MSISLITVIDLGQRQSTIRANDEVVETNDRRYALKKEKKNF
jgi:hypothetical protein